MPRARQKGPEGYKIQALHQENQKDVQPLHLAPSWEWSVPLFSGELANFLPVDLGSLGWSSMERSLSGCLVESLVSGFAIHLRVTLTEEEGEAFVGALRVNRMEDCPVVKMEGNMEVVDTEFKCRD